MALEDGSYILIDAQHASRSSFRPPSKVGVSEREGHLLSLQTAVRLRSICNLLAVGTDLYYYVHRDHISIQGSE
jgi:hypothetical protein